AFHAIRLHAIRRITQGRTATVTRSGGATTATSSEPTAPAPGVHVAAPAPGVHVAAPASGVHVLAPANITIQVAATGPGAGDSIATVDFDPWTRQDAFGAAIPQTRTGGNRFARVRSSTMRQVRYIPSGRRATMPDGDPMKSGDTVLDIRPCNEGDPRRPTVQAHLDGGAAASSTYHRFRTQPDLAIANADCRMLFPAG
ncbi:MAG TPA: glycoside hydrolase family 48 protein, partial [Rugosimonospora sp.]